jgi:MFS family permease
VPRLAARFGSRLVIAAGFAITAIGFGAIGFVQGDWRYGLFVIPLLAIAVGMGMSNGPATSVSTAAVPPEEVGSASGISNMARYVGAAVATAIAATIYSGVTANRLTAGADQADALASGLATASWVMAVFSAAGIALALLVARHRPTERVGGFEAAASSAAAVAHTVPVTVPAESVPEPRR